MEVMLKNGVQVFVSIWCFSFTDFGIKMIDYRCFHAIPRPLASLVSEGDINHSHQSFLEKGPITLPIILF